MSIANDNHILFCFKNSCIILLNKIGILMHITHKETLVSKFKPQLYLKPCNIFQIRVTIVILLHYLPPAEGRGREIIKRLPSVRHVFA